MSRVQLMDPGLMRYPLQWYRFIPDGGTDSNNHPTGNWTRIGTINGYVDGLGGSTGEEARALVHQASHRIYCQSWPDGSRFDLKDQLRWDGRVFEVGHVRNIEFQNQQLILTVVELQSDQ